MWNPGGDMRLCRFFVRFVLSGVFIFPAAAVAAAPPYVSGGLGPNAHWILAGSPYVVVGSVSNLPGELLTIDPGVVVKLSPAPNEPQGPQIAFVGTVLAPGTAAQPIIFT